MARAGGDAQGAWLQEQLLSERWPLEVTARARQTVSSVAADEATTDAWLARYQVALTSEGAHDAVPHQALLSHASDPVVSSEQLHELMNEIASWNLIHPDQADELAGLERVILGNPSLPLDVLEQVLQLPPWHPWPLSAWHNPAVALLLVRSPLSVLEQAAQRLLTHLGDAPSEAMSLEQLVAFCQRLDPERHPGHEQVGAMARRLADVFGLHRAST